LCLFDFFIFILSCFWLIIPDVYYFWPQLLNADLPSCCFSPFCLLKGWSGPE